MEANVKEIITISARETKEFAKKFAKNLTRPSILALYGSLGSGKTTFIQGLAKGLEIKKRVLSPTFVFVRPYRLDNRDQAMLYHVDLYRLDSEKDVEAIGLKEILENKKAIVAIEWPEKIESLLPKSTIRIKLEVLGENKRRMTMLTHLTVA